MKLYEKLNEIKQKSIANIPPELIAIMLKSTEELVQSGIADKAISVGEALPEFTLPDANGNLISSRDLLAKGPLAISFYRGIW
ncbi:hypothetical protein [Desulfosediminicola flagellatus]|uniref:hypothetical protein n=1 Tax=Desulfosediminicola flagellatus TaxID=2569541 RepID=UPI0010AB751F|nr:hypothetical protein [Desulfosediminicola flagellatus]